MLETASSASTASWSAAIAAVHATCAYMTLRPTAVSPTVPGKGASAMVRRGRNGAEVGEAGFGRGVGETAFTGGAGGGCGAGGAGTAGGVGGRRGGAASAPQGWKGWGASSIPPLPPPAPRRPLRPHPAAQARRLAVPRPPRRVWRARGMPVARCEGLVFLYFSSTLAAHSVANPTLKSALRRMAANSGTVHALPTMPQKWASETSIGLCTRPAGTPWSFKSSASVICLGCTG